MIRWTRPAPTLWAALAQDHADAQARAAAADPSPEAARDARDAYAAAVAATSGWPVTGAPFAAVQAAFDARPYVARLEA